MYLGVEVLARSQSLVSFVRRVSQNANAAPSYSVLTRRGEQGFVTRTKRGDAVVVMKTTNATVMAFPVSVIPSPLYAVVGWVDF